MSSNKRINKAYVRYDGTGRVISGSLILSRVKPTVGNWVEIDAYECCNSITTTTSTTTGIPTTTTSTTTLTPTTTTSTTSTSTSTSTTTSTTTATPTTTSTTTTATPTTTTTSTTTAPTTTTTTSTSTSTTTTSTSSSTTTTTTTATPTTTTTTSTTATPTTTTTTSTSTSTTTTTTTAAPTTTTTTTTPTTTTTTTTAAPTTTTTSTTINLNNFACISGAGSPVNGTYQFFDFITENGITRPRYFPIGGTGGLLIFIYPTGGGAVWTIADPGEETYYYSGNTNPAPAYPWLETSWGLSGSGSDPKPTITRGPC